MKWILLNEEKPPLDERVLVSTRNDLVVIDALIECERHNGTKYIQWKYGSSRINRVVAWQPLPKPYNAQRIDKSFLEKNKDKTVDEILKMLEEEE